MPEHTDQAAVANAAGGASASAAASDPVSPAGADRAIGLDVTQSLAAQVHLRAAEEEPPTPLPEAETDTLSAEGALDREGRYRITAKIAEGGMGAIYKGRDVHLGRDVAVKILRDTSHQRIESLRRFVEEAQIAGQLQHPGIVPVYDVGETPQKQPYFIMKLVKGKTLSAMLAARTSVDDDRSKFLAVFEHICQTLAYAHARGVIHRDLKPSNIMVGAFGEVQVMDWGLAKVLSGGAGSAAQADPQYAPDRSVVRTACEDSSSDDSPGSYTQAGSVLGTPAYMSPEQARGDLELIDERADVFGLGAVLCEILTGQPPFSGKPAEAQRRAQTGRLQEAFERLAGCGADPELIGLGQRCLAAEPWERPGHAGLVAADMTAYLAGVQQRLHAAELAHTAEQARAEAAQAAAAQERRAKEEAEARAAAERHVRRLTAGLAVVVIVALVAAGGIGFWLKQEHDAQARAAAQQLERIERAVQTDLKEAALLQSREQWADAKAAIERAQGRFGEPPLAEPLQRLADGIRGAQADLDMVARLEDIRMKMVKLDNVAFDYKRTEPDYAAAFAAYGLSLKPAALAQEAERIRASAIRAQLVAGLDYWLFVKWHTAPRDGFSDILMNARIRLGELGVKTAGPGAADPHVELLTLVDNDAWRQQLRDPVGRHSESRLQKLAAARDVLDQPPAHLALLGKYMRYESLRDKGTELLRRAHQRNPHDFWLSMELAIALDERTRVNEAVGFYRAALAVRPRAATVHFYLGRVLLVLGNLAEAEAAARQAVSLEPNHFPGLRVLGAILQRQDKLSEAEQVLRKALALRPKDTRAELILGVVLMHQGRFAASAKAWETAAASLPWSERRQVQTLGAQSRLLAQLEPRLDGVVRGEVQPKTAEEQLAFAEMCFFRKHWKAALRLYSEALAGPGSAGNLDEETLYRAACAAARVVGNELEGTEADHARYRDQALTWLQANLASWEKQFAEPEVRASVRSQLRLWQQTPHLAALRDAANLGKLPAAERKRLRQLWDKVSAILEKVAVE